MFGQTLGGDTLETNLPFEYPIDVCFGCLVSFPPDSVDTSKPQPNCLAPLPGASGDYAPCITGQDQPIDCRMCSSVGVCTP